MVRITHFKTKLTGLQYLMQPQLSYPFIFTTRKLSVFPSGPHWLERPLWPESQAWCFFSELEGTQPWCLMKETGLLQLTTKWSWERWVGSTLCSHLSFGHWLSVVPSVRSLVCCREAGFFFLKLIETATLASLSLVKPFWANWPWQLWF